MRIFRRNLHSLTGAYALDAVDGPERERFERHLNSCRSCEHDVRGLQETATHLAVLVARVPPPEMKAAVLAAAARTQQAPPIVERTRPAPRAVRRPRLAVAFATVATVLVIVLAVALVIQQRRLDHTRSQLHQVAAVQRRLRADIQDDRRLTALLNTPGVQLVSKPTSRGGAATVVLSRRLHKVIFAARGLPGLPNAKVYQLWLIHPNQTATSKGLLTLTSEGRVRPLLRVGFKRGDIVGVTVEPAGGTTMPTTKPIVLLALKAHGHQGAAGPS